MEHCAPASDKTVANVLASLLMAALWGTTLALGLNANPWRGAALPVAVFGAGWLAATIGLILVHRGIRQRGWDQVQDLLGALALLARASAVPLIVGGFLTLTSLWWHAPNLGFALYLNGLAVLGAFGYGYCDFRKTAQAMGYPRYYPALWGVGMVLGVTVAVQGLIAT